MLFSWERIGIGRLGIMCLIKFSFILITPSLHIGDPSFSMNRNMKNRSAYNQFTSYWQLLSKFWCSPHIGDYFQNFTIFKISKFWSSLHIGDPVKLLPLLSTCLNYLYHSLPRRSQIGPDWLIFYFVFCNSYFVFCILFFELFVTQSSSHHILGFSSMACDQYIN